MTAASWYVVHMAMHRIKIGASRRTGKSPGHRATGRRPLLASALVARQPVNRSSNPAPELRLAEDVVRADPAPDDVRLTRTPLRAVLEGARPSGAHVISQTPDQPWTLFTRKPGRNIRPAFTAATIAATAVIKRRCC
jgi:hypothetical protein